MAADKPITVLAAVLAALKIRALLKAVKERHPWLPADPTFMRTLIQECQRTASEIIGAQTLSARYRQLVDLYQLNSADERDLLASAIDIPQQVLMNQQRRVTRSLRAADAPLKNQYVQYFILCKMALDRLATFPKFTGE